MTVEARAPGVAVVDSGMAVPSASHAIAWAQTDEVNQLLPDFIK